MRQLQGLPELIISLAGRRLSTAEVSCVIAVRVRSRLGQPTQCSLAWNVAAAGAQGLDASPGDALRIEIGGRSQPLFAGEVTVVEYAHGADASVELHVRAYDALHRLRKRQHTRVFHHVDLRGLAEALVEGTGLAVSGSGPALGSVYQLARTDLDLLVSTSALAGRYPVVEEQALRLVDVAGEGEPVELILGENLHSAQVEVSQEPSFRRTETVRWDPDSASTTRETAESAIARATATADPRPASVGGGGTFRRADELVAEGLAGPLAQQELDLRAAAEVTADVVADGDPGLQAGRRMRLTGVVSRFEGTYPICEALHLLDASGYETQVSSRPPAAPPGRRPDVVTLGVVEDAADPEHRCRVTVRLTAHPDLVSGWLPVLLPGVGADKGLVTVPAPGDTVLVQLLGSDPERGVVLGGIIGTAPPPDAEGSAERARRFALVTPEGQRVLLDGPAGQLHLANGSGSSITLGADAMHLSSATDLVLEAVGRSITVRARTIDFEEAP